MLFPINPYGRSNLFIEYMLKDTAKVEKVFKIALLRYFNPVAAHPSGKIGEDPLLKPINIVCDNKMIKKFSLNKKQGNIL